MGSTCWLWLGVVCLGSCPEACNTLCTTGAPSLKACFGWICCGPAEYRQLLLHVTSDWDGSGVAAGHYSITTMIFYAVKPASLLLLVLRRHFVCLGARGGVRGGLGFTCTFTICWVVCPYVLGQLICFWSVGYQSSKLLAKLQRFSNMHMLPSTTSGNSG